MSDMPPPPPPSGPPPPPPGMSQPAPQPMGAAPSNGMGTAALVMGILQFLCLGTLGSILAIVFGKIGMNKADRGEATNRGTAKAGFILGIIGIILSVIGAIIAVVVIMNAPKIVSAVCQVPVQAAAPNTRLDGCDLTGAEFGDRSYVSWTLKDSNLTNANLSGTSWVNSEFVNSNLTGANFSGCQLSSVDFSGSNLSGANFQGCDFAKVSVAGANYDSSTIFPEGFTP